MNVSAGRALSWALAFATNPAGRVAHYFSQVRALRAEERIGWPRSSADDRDSRTPTVVGWKVVRS
ncbi:hypothetical protein MnTg02_00591 [bacterium MnTg02]|nr:hypothetical protein MnTg02_00591 [bacterium MnTg02]